MNCAKYHFAIILFETFLLVFDNKKELGLTKFAIHFVFDIMKIQKEPSGNSTLV